MQTNAGIGQGEGVEKRMAELLRVAADLIERGIIHRWSLNQEWHAEKHDVVIKIDATQLFSNTAQARLETPLTDRGEAVIDTKAIERRVMADRDRPCLYGVAGPCQHPKCLEAHFQTLYAKAQARASHPLKLPAGDR